MSSTRRLYVLTPEHRAQLKPWAERWIANALNCEPMSEIDRAAMRVAVNGMYEAAGLALPKHIVFVRSPLELALAGGFAAAIWHMRRQQEATLEATWAATSASTLEATLAATWEATREATRAATREATRAATLEATLEATLAATWEATREATREATGFLLSCAAAHRRMWDGGNQWSGCPAYLSFFRHVACLDLPLYARWQHYETAAIHGGPRIMHPDFCMVADRPLYIHLDERSLPHCATGAYCEWSDGWQLYYWHGVRVPERVIRGDYTAQEALAEPNVEVRRCMIERLGTEAFLKALKPRVIDRDEHIHHVPVMAAIPGVNEDGETIATYTQTGVNEVLERRELLRIALPQGDPDRHMLAVHVTCPSKGSEYYLRVPPNTKACQEAVAWTFGEQPETWDPQFES